MMTLCRLLAVLILVEPGKFTGVVAYFVLNVQILTKFGRLEETLCHDIELGFTAF